MSNGECNNEIDIVILADMRCTKIADLIENCYRDCLRKYHQDSPRWIGYTEHYDPDKKDAATFRYDGKTVIFDQSIYDKIADKILDLNKKHISILSFYRTGENSESSEYLLVYTVDNRNDVADHIRNIKQCKTKKDIEAYKVNLRKNKQLDKILYVDMAANLGRALQLMLIAS